MGKVFVFVKKEMREVIPPTLFFFVAFHILAVTRALMLREQGVEVATMAGATVAALVVGKVLLVADHLPFIDRFPERPLVYNIVWKTLVYLLASIVVRLVEHLVQMWPEGEGLSGAFHHLLEEVSWPRFLAVQIWLFVLLLVYTASRELIRAVGRERVLDMTFRKGRRTCGARS